MPDGSATTRPPLTVAPITIPALISTTFLMMYCPSSVGARHDGKDFTREEKDRRDSSDHLKQK